MGVAFQHCTFFFLFFEKHNWKKILKKIFFHLFYSNFLNIISEKEVKIFFFKYFFKNVFRDGDKVSLSVTSKHRKKSLVSNELC